jgi:hypothetical protein
MVVVVELVAIRLVVMPQILETTQLQLGLVVLVL